ncbi:MAG: ATP-dependent Clp protease ATP-binding subunit ClpC [Solirubrobacteraceae bacterium]|nr:ATP-dependent Clp protease ATP-binding subunit ClpC [Solirubrobacteraceae bacterium]
MTVGVVSPGGGGYTPTVGNGERHLAELLRRATNASDPDDALRAVTLLRGELDRLERDHVSCARVAGSSWSQIADALSITRQAAQKRHRGATPSASGPAPMRTVLVTAPARMAVRLGRQEARAMGSDVVGSEHLLLGILRSGDHHAVHVLREMGISLEHARAAAQPTLVDGRSALEPAGRDGISTYARSVLEQSLREAVDRGEGYIGVEHLLLALLREDAGGAARTLGALGVEADAVRERLACAPKAPRV